MHILILIRYFWVEITCSLPCRFVFKNFWFKETQYIVLDNFIVMTQIKKPLHIEYQFKTSETPILKKIEFIKVG